ncbi:MAG: hypothetical protein ACI9QL_003437 [Candidatus Omnitrophota bacterium]|jgi:hypothetical protein
MNGTAINFRRLHVNPKPRRNMLPALLIMLIPLLAGFQAHAVSPVQLSQKESPFSASDKIDELINTYHRERGISPLPLVNDETFVRRTYLDIAGRIPTFQETMAFLGSQEADKRPRLVEDLLDSEAFVHHMFTWWADLLRAKSRLSNQVPGGNEYVEWIKNNIRENRPYDEVVYDLITAEGYPRDNPAVGYYLRDTGMPLDNMSNTAQVFLGTRLQCAQCHDHPFDTWTQKQFYEMAAHTYDVKTRIRPQDNPMLREVIAYARKDKMKEVGQARMRGETVSRELMQPDRTMQRAYQEIFAPYSFGAMGSDRALRLPGDYAYDNARPSQRVEPKVIFGPEAIITHKDAPREVYAQWLTSPENPRFTTVIANRLWKKVMGRGLIEPVDDLTDKTTATYPELMAFLSAEMIRLDYDMKEFLKVLYRSKLYQREKYNRDITSEETYHFPGPVMTRMSAEQIWDSVMTLVVEDVDSREGRPVQQRYNDQTERAKVLENKTPEEIVEMANQLAALEQEKQENFAAIRKQAAEIQDPMARRRFIQKQGQSNRERQLKTSAILGGGSAMSMMSDRPYGNGRGAFLVRASELQSPMQPGSFLSQFGQSDREVIENANADASIPQILSMMNGQYSQSLLMEDSLLRKNLKADSAKPGVMLDNLFITLLSRRPDADEKALLIDQLKENGKMGIANIAWAILNTKQFIFIP